LAVSSGVGGCSVHAKKAKWGCRQVVGSPIGKMNFRTGLSYLVTGAGGIGAASGTGINDFLAGADGALEGTGAGVTLPVDDLVTTSFSQLSHSSQQSPRRNMSITLSSRSRTGVSRCLQPQPVSQPHPQPTLMRQAFSQVGGAQQAVLQQAAGAHGALQVAGLQQPILQINGTRHGFSHVAGAQTFVGAQGRQGAAHGAHVEHLPQVEHLPLQSSCNPASRPKSSKPNPGLHNATLTRSDPRMVLVFTSSDSFLRRTE
jgi:hypothetical protein